MVLAHAHYLTSAQCFALLPLLPLLQRSTDPDAALLDYDLDRNIVVVTSQRSYRYPSLLDESVPRPHDFAAACLQLHSRAPIL